MVKKKFNILTILNAKNLQFSNKYLTLALDFEKELIMQATESLKTSVDNSHEATLSNAGGFTAFSFGGYNIRFKAPYSLERYTDVVKWENGYLVVMAKYSHNAEPEESLSEMKIISMVSKLSWLEKLFCLTIVMLSIGRDIEVSLCQRQPPSLYGLSVFYVFERGRLKTSRIWFSGLYQ